MKFEWDVTKPARCKYCGSSRVTVKSYDFGRPYYLYCVRCKAGEPLPLREIRILDSEEVKNLNV